MQLLVHALSANIAVQSKFKIPEKQLSSLLVMIRYCRDLRQRASAPKDIRPRLVAFQILEMNLHVLLQREISYHHLSTAESVSSHYLLIHTL